jgi:hypothetical protein
LALFQGLRLLDEIYNKILIVFGDFTLRINFMLRASSPSDIKIIRIIKKIRNKVARFGSVEYYNILRVLNQKENHLSNLATQFCYGKIRKKKCGFILPHTLSYNSNS